MRVFGLDVESTGLDTSKDYIVELGLCLWETDKCLPLVLGSYYLYGPEYPDLGDSERVHGISKETLVEFGYSAKDVLSGLELFVSKHNVSYIVAHNGNSFDRPILLSNFKRFSVPCPVISTIPWIDTKVDLPHETKMDSNKLKYLACDYGFINPFSHRALTDVLTMMRLLSSFDINEVIENSKQPSIVIRALTSYEDRQLAKDAGFSWEKLGDKLYPRCWVKSIKENKLELESTKYKFKVIKI